MMILGSGSRRLCRLGRNDALLFHPPLRGGISRFPLSVFPDPNFKQPSAFSRAERPEVCGMHPLTMRGRGAPRGASWWRRVRDAAGAALARRGGRHVKRRPRLTALHSGGGARNARSAAAFVDTPGPCFSRTPSRDVRAFSQLLAPAPSGGGRSPEVPRVSEARDLKPAGAASTPILKTPPEDAPRGVDVAILGLYSWQCQAPFFSSPPPWGEVTEQAACSSSFRPSAQRESRNPDSSTERGSSAQRHRFGCTRHAQSLIESMMTLGSGSRRRSRLGRNDGRVAVARIERSEIRGIANPKEERARQTHMTPRLLAQHGLRRRAVLAGMTRLTPPLSPPPASCRRCRSR
jgi:hypothetical protein